MDLNEEALLAEQVAQHTLHNPTTGDRIHFRMSNKKGHVVMRRVSGKSVEVSRMKASHAQRHLSTLVANGKWKLKIHEARKSPLDKLIKFDSSRVAAGKKPIFDANKKKPKKIKENHEVKYSTPNEFTADSAIRRAHAAGVTKKHGVTSWNHKTIEGSSKAGIRKFVKHLKNVRGAELTLHEAGSVKYVAHYNKGSYGKDFKKTSITFHGPGKKSKWQTGPNPDSVNHYVKNHPDHKAMLNKGWTHEKSTGQIVEVGGAGEEGTAELVQNYVDMTPGQAIPGEMDHNAPSPYIELHARMQERIEKQLEAGKADAVIMKINRIDDEDLEHIKGKIAQRNESVVPAQGYNDAHTARPFNSMTQPNSSEARAKSDTIYKKKSINKKKNKDGSNG